jgi:DNA-binding beta-propeller fold protein YncE
MQRELDGHRPDGQTKPRRQKNKKILAGLGAALMLLSVGRAAPAFDAKPLIPAQGSTSPSNGDLVPYGLAVVPDNFPGHTLKPGQFLVSNFNSSVADGNLAGQGKTIVIIDPTSAQQLGVFFQGTSPIGFTNALAIVPEGFVFAGSVFTTKPDASDPTPGPLLVFDKNGNLVDSITTGTNGPWGLAVNDLGDSAQLFVSNVFDGTVTRLNVSFQNGSVSVGSPTTIGSGYASGLDPAALVVGPAGLAYDSQHDRLYVASEDDNQIFVIQHASTTVRRR